jgi:protein-tyrosine phosphatase
MTGVPGTFNFRDLGGLRAGDGVTRHGVLMRSDAPVRLGDEGRAALRELGIRAAIDLREPVERELDPVDFDGLPIAVHARPLFDGSIDMEAPKELPGLYLDVVERCGPQIAGAIGLLGAADALPAVFFCSAGKDRTGLVAALTLSAVGVDDADVAAEYARTERVMQGSFRKALEARARAAGLNEQLLAVRLGAPAELMLGTLAELRRRHGGAADYLRANGMGSADLDALRSALVGP